MLLHHYARLLDIHFSRVFIHINTSESQTKFTIPEGLDTFPKLLTQQGYQTACVGKMHFTPTYQDVGFQKMHLAEQDGQGRYNDDYHQYLCDNDLIDAIDMRDQVWDLLSKAPREHLESFGTIPSNLEDKDYSTTWIGNQGIEMLKSSDENNNCLMVGFIKPHHPFDVPAPWSEESDPQNIPLLPGWTDTLPFLDEAFHRGFYDNRKLTPESLQKVMAQYYASITQIDYWVGQMIALLKERGFYENTLIIYTSDHGDYMGFHHMILKGNYMYDPVIKVPLIVKYPQQQHAGTIEDKFVSVIDITCTILDTAECVGSQNLWKQIEPLEDRSRDTVFAETMGHQFMIRTQTRKLLYYPPGKSQYFNLEEDPLEMVNLYEDPNYQNEITSMKERLLNWLAMDAAPLPHVDEEGSIINGENLPDVPAESHQKMESYLRSRMKDFLVK